MPVETVDRVAAALEAEAARVSTEVDNFFANLLSGPGDSRDRLYEAMRHAAIGGGKRLRPLLTIAASKLFAIDPSRALRVGCAIEAIHVYSLIHDDLPCMDDADLRRGKPTVHNAFGEAGPFWPGIASTRLPSRFLLTRQRMKIRGCVRTSASSLLGRLGRAAWPAVR
jgi:farnesyl diphosphate synthase